MLKIFSSVGYLGFAFVISKSDITRRVISNKSLLIFATISMILNLDFLGFSYLLNLSLAAFLLIALHLVFKGRIGPGDLKLFLVMTIWAPVFSDWLEFFAWAWIFGGIFSIASSLFSRRITASIPFAPFIFLAFLTSI